MRSGSRGKDQNYPAREFEAVRERIIHEREMQDLASEVSQVTAQAVQELATARSPLYLGSWGDYSAGIGAAPAELTNVQFGGLAGGAGIAPMKPGFAGEVRRIHAKVDAAPGGTCNILVELYVNGAATGFIATFGVADTEVTVDGAIPFGAADSFTLYCYYTGSAPVSVDIGAVVWGAA